MGCHQALRASGIPYPIPPYKGRVPKRYGSLENTWKKGRSFNFFQGWKSLREKHILIFFFFFFVENLNEPCTGCKL
jgi:hypothetical protein